MNYTEAVEYINEIPKFTTKNKFEHTKEMMRRLGNPEAHMKIIEALRMHDRSKCIEAVEEHLGRTIDDAKAM